jgi:outer membrane protein, heavy metal efflux system
VYALVLLLADLFAGAQAQQQAQQQPAMTMDQAVSIALQRNRDVIAARLDVEAAQVERIAAGIYPNPDFSYSFNNIVLGKANPQCTSDQGCISPAPFDQGIQTVSISQVLDVWLKRGIRKEAANHGVDQARFALEDALREVVYAVRSAFADVAREQEERQLAHDMRVRYDETIRLSRARFKAGDISENELRKIELEGLKYQNAEIDEDMQLELARHKLAALLGQGSPAALPSVAADRSPERAPLSLSPLVERALRERPDLRAVRTARLKADADLRAAHRDPWPDPSLGIAYTHDNFTISGDNPNTLALTLSFPLPVFDRNQAGIGRASVEVRRSENDEVKLALQVQREVGEAVRHYERSRVLLDAFEGGMLERADLALRAAEKSYKVGAVSLLELLEAQRTYIDTRAQYLKTAYDYRQATIDLGHAVGGQVK